MTDKTLVIETDDGKKHVADVKSVDISLDTDGMSSRITEETFHVQVGTLKQVD